MICAIMQPTYIPWIGYFDLIDKVDTFVFYDDVQLTKRSWQVRNKIKGPQGEIWLSLPIKKTNHRNELLIKYACFNNNEKWFEKHLKTIEFNYKKSPFFNEVIELLRKNYNKHHLTLGEFNIQMITDITKRIGIKTELIKSSDLPNIMGKKDERLTQICESIGATEYLSPQGSATYINEQKKGGKFVEKGINLFYHNYNHPEYLQLYGVFIPYLGIFDLLFNVGFKEAIDVIRAGRLENIHFMDM